MSHLPLDARAILHHLNELGYRNISAEQLREFLKGMQPQSDKQSAIKSKFATTTTAAATTRANTQQQQQQQHQPEQHQQNQPNKYRRSKVKVIKSKRPLCHFKFYLDICDHQLTKRIEADIKALGGSLEFFLNDSITHFITDKEKSSSLPQQQQQHQQSHPGTPQTPATPTTTTSALHEDGNAPAAPTQLRKGRQTRADAILSRARGIQSTNQSIPSQERRQHQSLEENRQGSYAIWKTEYALRFLQRIQTELRSYIQGGALQATSTPATTAGNIQLKRNFIKIESIKRNHRPYYHLLKQQEEWPKIDFCSEDGAFRLTARAEVVDAVQSMTRKSQVGSRTSQRQQDKDKDKDQQHKKPLQQQVLLPLPATLHGGTKKQLPDQSLKTINRGEVKESSDKQCGVCEICKVEYDILTIHLQSKDHELFAKNAQNFLALDTLIQVSASVESFLEREEQEQLKQKELGQQQEEEEEDKDKADELQTDDSDMEVDERLSDSAIAASIEKNNCNKASNNNNNNNSNSNNNNNNSSRQQRPSPVLREKSKRITKGKHSSEKFQATPPAHSPVNPQTASPNRKLTTLQDQNQPIKAAGNNVETAQQPAPNTTRRKTMNSVLSPPFRAMLPPSSLYKVVEASDVMATPSRGVRGRGAGGGGAVSAATVDSPSLIVKFQKVRQSELQRLNGEAENFMFPRSNARSSSELPTDVDRQTTSDIRGHHSIASSASLDTTSEADVSTYPQQQQQQQAQLATPANQQQQQQKRATAVGRRRKGSAQAQAGGGGAAAAAGGSTSSSVPPQQRFPSAPIQPEMQSQLLRPTRKSSRMATAIVTAATTSSQLQLRRQRGNNKMEDRMGEQSQTTTTTTTKKTELQLNRNNLEEDDEEGEDEDEEETNEDSSCSSGSDEDYIGNLAKCTSKANCVDTREERAARRLLRLTLTLNRGVRGARGVDAVANKSLNRRSSSGKQHKATPATAAATAGHHKQGGMGQSKAPLLVTNDLLFDCSKSERMQKMRYEFEKLPTADLWHRVFQRQDAGEEHYYCYYGTTRYRKLPYEQGPIPMELTKPHSCTLCTQHVQVKKEEPMEQQQQQLDQSNSSQMQVYKHKKLQLLQRYQQQQQQQQQQEPATAPPPGALKSMVPLTTKCDSKASTPELMERDLVPLSERAQIVERVRATSTQSSTSSSCSNSQKSSSRHKQLARLVELPPRKSPREHASTLALVSCIIRQRQDSQSKTNSEAEETPPMPAAVKLPGVKQEAAAPPPSPAASTRLQTATPVEEMRFATEISETVKRMRRGQNKYDTLPARAPTPVRSRRAAAAAAPAAPAPAPSVSYSRRLQLAKREAAASSNSSSGVILGKRKRRHNAAGGTPLQQQQQQTPGVALLAGVRKLPSKKGLLEYEMEKSALNTLNASMKFVNPMLIAWEIDKYLELTGREYDLNVAEQEEDTLDTAPPCSSVLREEQVQTPPSSTDCCFTSEFDLCDLLAAEAGADSGDDEGAAATSSLRRNTSFNWFAGHQRKRKCLKSNRTGWPRVQRRRGGGVANARLPLVEEAKDSQQQLQLQQQGIKQEPLETEEEQTTTTTTTATITTTRRTTTSAEKELSKQEEQEEDDNDDDDPDEEGGKELLDKKQPAAMTPPATDLDERLGNDEEEIEMDIELEHTDDNEEAEENDESQLDYDDDETIADLVENQNSEAEIEATDADVEDDDAEDDDEDEDEDDENDDDDVYEDAYGEATKETPDPLAIEQDEQDEEEEEEDDDDDLTASYTKPNVEKPLPARQSTEHSPEKKPFLVNRYCLNVTSTPSTHSGQQQQRRTPQLNGSLESCISPSEKLGDNSDIFTVSSDGLDTDMDLSNTQAGDSLEQHQPQQQTTPKRKFDISKYAPPKNAKAASSCAAEAATAAVKSLAISQFLKKEVRVTCRRLRAPFRRFRYRR